MPWGPPAEWVWTRTQGQGLRLFLSQDSAHLPGGRPAHCCGGVGSVSLPSLVAETKAPFHTLTNPECGWLLP